MTQSWLGALELLAVLAILILLLGAFAWVRRLGRRVRLLEVAARHSSAERQAVPEPLAPELEITLPRFIGSPYPSRRGS